MSGQDFALTTPSSLESTPVSDANDVTWVNASYDTVYNGNITNRTLSPPPLLTPYNFTEYRIAHAMFGVYPIITATVGTIGNVMALVVLLRKKLRRSSPCAYMSALAITDTIVLWSVLFGMVSVVYHKWITGPAFCKVLYYFQTMSSQMSAWLVVAMTVERFIVVYFPFKSGKFCSVRNARIAIVVMALFFAVLSIHEFFTTYHIAKRQHCDHDLKTHGKFLEVYNYIDACLSSLVPMALLFTFNILIIHKIRMSDAVRKDMAGSNTDTQASQSRQVTGMLLAVSITYCVLLIPYSTFYISQVYWIEYSKPETYALATLIQHCCILLIMINHSINFILYFFTGKKFRNELRRVFCCWEEEKDPRTSMYSMSTTATTKPNINKSTASMATELSSV